MVCKKKFAPLEYLFHYYNQELFHGELYDCLMNRKKGAAGFFALERWIDAQKQNMQKTPPLYPEWESMEFHAAFVHEMVHVWQHISGKPSRAGYHNAEFARKMEEIGLIPSSTGEPGGKKTGQKMSQYSPPVGSFINKYKEFWEKDIEYKLLPVLESTTASGTSKTKYQCPACGKKIWGKTNELVPCYECFELMTEKEAKEESISGKQKNLKNHKETAAAKKVLAILREKKNHLHKKLMAAREDG